MKTLLPLVFFTMLLCGCPDTSKLPKVPPQVPEPKLSQLMPGTSGHAQTGFAASQPLAPETA
ncbi:MAG: hypothetical protein V4646_04815 [Pseudomonadota bacterium]